MSKEHLHFLSITHILELQKRGKSAALMFQVARFASQTKVIQSMEGINLVPWPPPPLKQVQVFVFAIMDCKCVSEADASVTQSFWIHPILQLLVQSKSFSEFWLQSIIRTGYNLFFKLGTLEILTVPVKAYAVILRETWTPIQEIFQDRWLVVEARTSCVTSIWIPCPPPESKLRVLQLCVHYLLT